MPSLSRFLISLLIYFSSIYEWRRDLQLDVRLLNSKGLSTLAYTKHQIDKDDFGPPKFTSKVSCSLRILLPTKTSEHKLGQTKIFKF